MIRCLPQTLAKRHHSRREHNWRSQHQLPKANIIQKDHICPVDKCGLFVGAGGGGRPYVRFASNNIGTLQGGCKSSPQTNILLARRPNALRSVPDFTALPKKQYTVLFFLTPNPLGFDPLRIINIKRNQPFRSIPFNLVPVAGVEPARYRYQRILSPSRLPIPSHRRICYLSIIH